ncbi:hypothetical protein NEOLEDRAFT_168087 [Neolentinus lepideus HHB14362 ss-1]|uniref:Uncharacterized protein n=1 Tax=Neolentinus lepideus HHB14362 ss-1 TaxID=1314782 RepID=A0A165MKX4_9AGAM|nr:hypothetical protein NEOLEDRAFT_168087 [Neolentinus lepideus HHB14362 ss-1]
MPRHRTPTRSQSALTVARATSPSLHWQHGSVRQTYQQAITKFLSPAQVRRLLDDVRTLAHAHLDMDRAVRQQAPGKWDAFIRQATQDFPIFARFPNSWPLRDYITRHIANRRSTLRAGSGKSKGRDEKMEKENTDARVDGGDGGSKTEKAVGLREVGQTVHGTKTYISETFGRARNLLQSADASQVLVPQSGRCSALIDDAISGVRRGAGAAQAPRTPSLRALLSI